MTLLEPDVALTDFALAAECALFSGWLWLRHGPGNALRQWFIVLFAALSAGSLLGGITHGFFGSAQTDMSRAIWVATLVSIAGAALACWAIGAHLLVAEHRARPMVAAATVLLAVNLATVFLVSQTFLVAIAFYAPAVLFVLAGLITRYERTRNSVLLPGIVGVVLSLLAAVIQQTQTEALGLSHNALYHVVQAVALLLMFITARSLMPVRISGALAS